MKEREGEGEQNKYERRKWGKIFAEGLKYFNLLKSFRVYLYYIYFYYYVKLTLIVLFFPKFISEGCRL